jgi:hypothetical protein
MIEEIKKTLIKNMKKIEEMIHRKTMQGQI